jgi:hypothetical protein
LMAMSCNVFGPTWRTRQTGQFWGLHYVLGIVFSGGAEIGQFSRSLLSSGLVFSVRNPEQYGWSCVAQEWRSPE